jgi:hypothetical protein
VIRGFGQDAEFDQTGRSVGTSEHLRDESQVEGTVTKSPLGVHASSRCHEHTTGRPVSPDLMKRGQ